MLTKEEVLRVWAPPEALWSRWVKPVLFAFADGTFEIPPAPSKRLNLDWAPGSAAIVVDLPGEDSVVYGIELARCGYRPVPLYNALPFPVKEKDLPPHARSRTTVDVLPILAAICRETETLKQLRLATASPPAFLVDADRRIARIDPESGVFDNRAVCFETDFPSADFLLSHGLGTAIVVQEDAQIAGDLSQILIQWQQRGIHVLLKQIGDSSPPRSVIVQRPSFLRRIWFRIAVALDLHRGELGAFGGIVPSGGG